MVLSSETASILIRTIWACCNLSNTRSITTIHPRVDRVPVTEALRQATLFATVIGDVQDHVQHIQAVQANVAAL
jgi:ribosome-binding factor A